MAEVMGKACQLIAPAHQPVGGLIAGDSSLNTHKAKALLSNFCPSLEQALHYSFGDLIPPYFYAEDERGYIMGVINDGLWREVNYIETGAGVARGGHYHKGTKEGFFIIDGKIKVTLADLKKGTKKTMSVGRNDFFVVEPGVLHTFVTLEKARWINMLSKAMSEESKDIYYLKT